MNDSLSTAEETEAQRDWVTYQIHVTSEVGFKPQCLIKSPLEDMGLAPVRMHAGGESAV